MVILSKKCTIVYSTTYAIIVNTVVFHHCNHYLTTALFVSILVTFSPTMSLKSAYTRFFQSKYTVITILFKPLVTVKGVLSIVQK